MKVCSSCCSDVESLIVLLISAAGAPGFSSILWFQGLFGGNFFDSLSLKMSAKAWYCFGILSSTSIRQMVAFLPRVLVANIALLASSVQSTIGSC